MEQNFLKHLLLLVQNGQCSVDSALQQLKHFPAETMPDACIDHHRSLRTGMPEVIYGASKSAAQIISIAKALLPHTSPVLVTKVGEDKARAIRDELPAMVYHQAAEMLSAREIQPGSCDHAGTIAVICAGTSDMPIAEEAAVTAESLGNPIARIYDVGIAGIHRLLAHRPLFDKATAIIAVAGMEGALPGVIAGLVSCPVIGVPTSIGYGTSFGGIAALLSMLNSCAPGLAVVNINNGFGAACMAHAINLGRICPLPQK